MGMTESHAHVADALMVVLGKQSVRRASSQNRRRKSSKDRASGEVLVFSGSLRMEPSGYR